MVELGIIQTNQATVHPFLIYIYIYIKLTGKRLKKLTGNIGEVIGKIVDEVVEVIDESEKAGGFSMAFAVDAVDFVTSFNQSSSAA